MDEQVGHVMRDVIYREVRYESSFSPMQLTRTGEGDCRRGFEICKKNHDSRQG